MRHCFLILLGLGCNGTVSDTAIDNTLFCEEDPNNTRIEEDADCDGVPTEQDCDDNMHTFWR